jgi:Pvc16 N-terminal domain
MIDEALLLLRNELVVYLAANGYGPEANADTIVVIENIAQYDSGNAANLDDKIVLTLVNVEEESTLKNAPHVKKDGSSAARYENPPVYLNLYLLVSSCNKASDNANYQEALRKLSHVIRFFQGKNSFSHASASTFDPLRFGNDDLVKLSLKAELYTLTFEQINHLWGTLGGKQMPSVMYKLRLVAITGRKQVREVPLIEEIQTHLTKVPDDC